MYWRTHVKYTAIAAPMIDFPERRPHNNHNSWTALVGECCRSVSARYVSNSPLDMGRPNAAFKTARQVAHESPPNTWSRTFVISAMIVGVNDSSSPRSIAATS